jgi:hypothetical protein
MALALTENNNSTDWYLIVHLEKAFPRKHLLLEEKQKEFNELDKYFHSIKINHRSVMEQMNITKTPVFMLVLDNKPNVIAERNY